MGNITFKVCLCILHQQCSIVTDQSQLENKYPTCLCHANSMLSTLVVARGYETCKDWVTHLRADFAQTVSRYKLYPGTKRMQVRTVSRCNVCPCTNCMHPWTVSRYKLYPGTNCTLVRTVSSYKLCPGTDSVQVKNVSRYEMYPGTTCIQIQTVSSSKLYPGTKRIHVWSVSRYKLYPGTKSIQVLSVSMYKLYSGTICIQVRAVSRYIISMMTSKSTGLLPTLGVSPSSASHTAQTRTPAGTSCKQQKESTYKTKQCYNMFYNTGNRMMVGTVNTFSCELSSASATFDSLQAVVLF